MRVPNAVAAHHDCGLTRFLSDEHSQLHQQHDRGVEFLEHLLDLDPEGGSHASAMQPSPSTANMIAFERARSLPSSPETTNLRVIIPWHRDSWRNQALVSPSLSPTKIPVHVTPNRIPHQHHALPRHQHSLTTLTSVRKSLALSASESATDVSSVAWTMTHQLKATEIEQPSVASTEIRCYEGGYTGEISPSTQFEIDVDDSESSSEHVVGPWDTAADEIDDIDSCELLRPFDRRTDPFPSSATSSYETSSHDPPHGAFGFLAIESNKDDADNTHKDITDDNSFSLVGNDGRDLSNLADKDLVRFLRGGRKWRLHVYRSGSESDLLSMQVFIYILSFK